MNTNTDVVTRPDTFRLSGTTIARRASCPFTGPVRTFHVDSFTRQNIRLWYRSLRWDGARPATIRWLMADTLKLTEIGSSNDAAPDGHTPR